MCYNMDEPWKYAKWNKSETKGYILHYSGYWMSTISKCIEIEDKWFQGLEVGGSEKWEMIAKGDGVFWWGW